MDWIIDSVYETLYEGVLLPLSYFADSKKRIYGLYLVSSALLALWVYKKTRRKEGFFKYLFNPKVWFSESAVVDYYMLFFNGVLKVALLAPYLIYGPRMAFWVNDYMVTFFGYPKTSLGMVETIVLYTLAITIFGDFMTYILHLLMHRIPFLWAFHKVHHSATTLNPITQYRIHPVELIINNARGIFVFGLLTGIFDYLSNYQVGVYNFMGVNILSFLFLFWGANLRHSHVKLKYFDWLEYIIISPYQHQVHHSDKQAHYDKNLGAKLAVWDWMFGTLVRSKEVNTLHFGLGEENRDYTSFWGNLLAPFKHVFVGLYKMIFGEK